MPLNGDEMKTIKKEDLVAQHKNVFKIFETLHLLENNGVAENPAIFNRGSKLAASILAATIITSTPSVNAALVSPCSGVSLAPSIVTGIVGEAVLPIASSLDGVLGLLLQPVGINSNLTNTLAGIAAGDPINLNILDANGNIISPADQECQTTADGYSLDTPKGIFSGGEIVQLKIVGHTDRLGDDNYNMKLSEARAETIRQYLIAKNVPAERITAVGIGESTPLVECNQNKPDETLIRCLEPNRRFEIEAWTVRKN